MVRGWSCAGHDIDIGDATGTGEGSEAEGRAHRSLGKSSMSESVLKEVQKSLLQAIDSLIQNFSDRLVQ